MGEERTNELISMKSMHDFPMTVVSSCNGKLELNNYMESKSRWGASSIEKWEISSRNGISPGSRIWEKPFKYLSCFANNLP